VPANQKVAIRVKRSPWDAAPPRRMWLDSGDERRLRACICRKAPRRGPGCASNAAWGGETKQGPTVETTSIPSQSRAHDRIDGHVAFETLGKKGLVLDGEHNHAAKK